MNINSFIPKKKKKAEDSQTTNRALRLRNFIGKSQVGSRIVSQELCEASTKMLTWGKSSTVRHLTRLAEREDQRRYIEYIEQSPEFSGALVWHTESRIESSRAHAAHSTRSFYRLAQALLTLLLYGLLLSLDFPRPSVFYTFASLLFSSLERLYLLLLFYRSWAPFNLARDYL